MFFYTRFILRLVLLFSHVPFSLSVMAQQNVVIVEVKDKSNGPLQSVTVKLTHAGDTLIIVQKITDTKGIAVFTIAPGPYIISASSVGFNIPGKQVVVTGKNRFTLTANAATSNLAGVVVTATRPLMRQEDDKTIVEPEALAASSTNSYEILEKTPGLFVDQDGNVYLSSTTPARIYINGREQKMSAQDIAGMLKSLPPNSIQSIELLRTPSARYDASGSGGIVNIVLKKGVRLGLTGSVSAGFNQGRYGNQFVGFNLNNSRGKLNTYINTQYSRRKSYDRLYTDRLFATDSLLSQDATTLYPGSSLYVGAGVSYEVNKKWELNYDGRISISKFDNSSENYSTINKISQDRRLTSNLTSVENEGRNANISQSISAKYKIDSTGSEWTTDLSYTGTPGSSQQDFVTAYGLPARSPFAGNGDINTRFHFFSAASNLLWKFPKKLTLEAGWKSTFSDFKNTSDYFRQLNGSMVRDDFRTASFKYNENINAGFLQASKTIKSITVKVGTRLENTNMTGNQLVPKDTSFSINRTDLFPYIYISRNLMTIMTYELRAYLVYRRTINRPSYELLNPFPRFIDQYMFETGNPSLRPQFTQNYEANISVNERPVFAIGVNDTKDIFTNVVYQSDTSKSLAYRTYDNMGKNKETYFRILGAIPPGKRYFIVAGAQYNHNHYDGQYENKPLQWKRGSWSMFTYQTLRITPTTQFVLNGFVRFNGQLQFYELSTFGALNMSINQQLLKKKLTISLSASDVFFTNRNEFSLAQGSVKATGRREADTRRFGINLRYNFGIRKREENNFLDMQSPEGRN